MQLLEHMHTLAETKHARQGVGGFRSGFLRLLDAGRGRVRGWHLPRDRSMRLRPFAVLLVLLVALPFAVAAQPVDCPGAPFARLYTGGQGIVTPGEPNNLRAQPSLNAEIVGQIPPGAIFTVLEGPQCAEEYYWYQIEFEGLTGWTAESTFEAYFVAPYYVTDLDTSFYNDGTYVMQLSYDTRVAENALVTFSSFTGVEEGPGSPQPEFTRIAFENYDMAAQQWQRSGQEIVVYNVNTFEGATPAFAQQLDLLRAALAARPNLPDALPTLPIITAPQVFASNAAYLDFENGSGIRFVTAHSFDVSPISADRLAYNFQGLTNDGQYYVAAYLPLTTRVLPEVDPMEMFEEAGEFEAYLEQVTTALEGATDFAPSLQVYDTMMSSLSIVPPLAVTFGGEAAYENFSLTYDPALASRVEVRFTEAFIDPGGMSMFGSEPANYEFAFYGYPYRTAFQQPRVLFFPIDTFAADSAFASELARLRETLADPSLLASIESDQLAGQVPTIPVLPLVNAGQLFVSQVELLTFEGGRGVRFITHYAQDVSPFTNQNVFYTFQGVTDDGRYAVAAYFPIRTDALPDDVDPASFDYEALAARFNDYRTETVTALNALTPDAFQPPLSSLDAIIQSLRAG